MSEFEWMIFFERALWIGCLSAPLLAGVAAVVIARRPTADHERTCLIGSACALSLGGAGSFVNGKQVIGTLTGSGDIPYFLIAEAWQRMWYPFGIGLFVGFALVLYALLSQKQEAA